MMNRHGFFGSGGLSFATNERETTWLVLGRPGSGKTYGLVSWALDDIAKGKGVGFIDPHEDAFRLMLRQVATYAKNDAGLAERVVVVDPTEPEWVVGINPLELFGELEPQRVAWFLTDIVLKILRIDPSQAPRMVSILSHTLMALAELGLTLYELPLFLRDHEWRNRVIDRVGRSEARDYLGSVEIQEFFEKEFPQNERLRSEWSQSTLNKMGRFVTDPDILLMVGQRKSTINFRSLIDSSNIAFYNLSKGRLGPQNSQLLGSFIVGLHLNASLSRADIEAKDRRSYYLYIDEWQNFMTDHIQEILSESRKYSLSLILANQYLDQLPPAQRAAVLRTAGTLISFNIGYQDAAILAPEMFVPKPHKTRWDLYNIGPIPLVLLRQEKVPADEERQKYIQELMTLNPREFWVRQRGSPHAFKQRTRDVTVPDYSQVDVDSLVTLSGLRYARRKEEVRRELINDRPRLLAELAGGYEASRDPGDYWDVPPLYGW